MKAKIIKDYSSCYKIGHRKYKNGLVIDLAGANVSVLLDVLKGGCNVENYEEVSSFIYNKLNILIKNNDEMASVIDLLTNGRIPNNNN